MITVGSIWIPLEGIHRQQKLTRQLETSETLVCFRSLFSFRSFAKAGVFMKEEDLQALNKRGNGGKYG